MLRILYDTSPMTPKANERGLQAFHAVKKQILGIMEDVKTDLTDINIIISFPPVNETSIYFVGTDKEVADIIMTKIGDKIDIKSISKEILSAGNN